ncbi:hypothetical protein GGI12_002423 [Dipsacomyces acuminosporus]|nr:hypothetical protein GGI12_002423 [Dipsacomyces acuminosporus]
MSSSDRLYTLSTRDHANQVVEAACKVLYLRSTTQVDELMSIASVSIQQRWDFIGPSVSDAPDPNAALFAAIDHALQWQRDDIGDFVRHQHFGLELTEDQAEVLNSENVSFERADSETMRARVPFAKIPGHPCKTYFVELVWEDEKWRYFNLAALNGVFPKIELANGGHLASTVQEADSAFDQQNTKATGGDDDGNDNDDDDDDYWNQFPQPDAPKQTHVPKTGLNKRSNNADNESDDDYWTKYDHLVDSDEPGNQNDSSELAETHPQPEQSVPANALLLGSVQDSLSAAAKVARTTGIPLSVFLQLAQAAYDKSGDGI